MNDKKGQFVTLGIIMVVMVLVGGFIYIEGELEKRKMVLNYVGDSSTNRAYNIKSNNPNCDINNIMINQNYIEYFNDISEIPEGYTIDENCN